MRFGRFELTAIDAGRFTLDGGAMFGVVPRSLWQEHAPPDEHNGIPLCARLLLIEEQGSESARRILVDTGISRKLGAKMAGHLRVQAPPDGVRGALRQAGVDPDSITDVILTHLHFDHAGGVTEPQPDGSCALTFPRATYHLQRRALKWAEHAPEKDVGSFHPADYQELGRSTNLHLLDGPTELVEGVSVILSEGHTVAQQLPLIDGDETRMLFCADVIPTRPHIRLPWIMAYDLYPLSTLEEKRLLLAQGLEEGWILFFEHDPTVAACRLAERNGKVIAGEQVPL